MKRRLLIFIITAVFCTLSLTACNNSNPEIEELKTTVEGLTNQVEGLQGEVAALTSQVSSLESDLEEVRSLSVIDNAIEKSKVDNMLAEVDDKYFMTVEITKDNFYDYFDFALYPQYDAMGEVDGSSEFRVISKVRDEWLVYKEENVAIRTGTNNTSSTSIFANRSFSSSTYFNEEYLREFKESNPSEVQGTVTFVSTEIAEKQKEGNLVTLYINGMKVSQAYDSYYPEVLY